MAGQTPTAPPTPGWLGVDRLAFAVVVVAAATCLTYVRTFDVPWYFDDTRALVENPAIRDLAQAARGAFGSRGLGDLTFALDFARAGYSVSAFHFTNLLIHLLAALFALLALRRLFPGRHFLALFGALVFALHPLQTAAVTYVVQRYASLSAMLCLGALVLYLRARALLASPAQGVRGRWLVPYLGAVGAGAAACFVKQNAVVLPVLLVLVELLHPESGAQTGQRALRRRLLGVAPFFLVPLWVAVPEVGGGVGVATTPRMPYETDVVGTSVTPLAYLATQAEVLWRYLRLVVVPYGQVFDLGLPVATNPWNGRAVVAALGHAAVLAGAVALRRTAARLTLGAVWFFAALGVESSVVVLDPYFEHRLYLPMFGVAVAAAEVLGRAWGGGTPRRRAAVGAAIVIALGALTVRRNEQWRDPVRLWLADLAAGSQSYRSLLGLADALYRRGDTQAADQVYAEFLARAQRRCQSAACGARYLLNMGTAAERLGKPDLAMALYRRVLEQSPGYARAYFNLGVLLYQASSKLEAQASFRRAMELAPGDGEAAYNWAISTVELGRPEEARAVLVALRAVRPDLARQLAEALDREAAPAAPTRSAP